MPVTDAALAAGIANAYLRGRLERHDVDGVEWVFDVGHNPAAAAVLAASIAAPAGRRLARGSCSPPCATRISPASSQPFVATAAGWFVAQANADRGATGAELGALLESLGAERVVVAADVAAACAAARSTAARGDRVVVYGSFHTVGAATRGASAILRTLPIG